MADVLFSTSLLGLGTTACDYCRQRATCEDSLHNKK